MMLRLLQAVIFRLAKGPFIEDFYQCVTYGFYTAPWQEQLYTSFSLLFMFLIPLCILITTYSTTFATIAKIGSPRQNGLSNAKSNRWHGEVPRNPTLNPSTPFGPHNCEKTIVRYVEEMGARSLSRENRSRFGRFIYLLPQRTHHEKFGRLHAKTIINAKTRNRNGSEVQNGKSNILVKSSTSPVTWP
ncbi:hypothetical protein AVEN_196975-1 [Araneus ventricosus]|uniref:Uncharacterized protein n=1 Tax=Araneus ventricosus TaxID=182803 RepID=A0A4Y2JFX0_ARAVE|nr:hypothetical protein AVEN_196975-1 [Araneus ventricosus]